MRFPLYPIGSRIPALVAMRMLSGVLTPLVIAALVVPAVRAQAPPTSANNKTQGFWNQPYDWDDSPSVHMILMRGRGPATSGTSQVMFFYSGANVKLWQPKVLGAAAFPETLTNSVSYVSKPCAVNL